MPSGKEKEFYSGLKRGAIMQLVLPCAANEFKPPVKSITMRRPGTVRGKRLLVLQGIFGPQMGLLTYLRKLQNEQSLQHEAAASSV